MTLESVILVIICTVVFLNRLLYLLHSLALSSGEQRLRNYRRFIAGSTHVSRIINLEKLHSAKKRNKIKFQLLLKKI
jgi:hypothetical protein